MVRSLRAAASFLTRLPLGGEPTATDTARSVVWFPLVGAGVGALVGAVRAGLGPVVSPLTAAALAVTAGALVTGGFHEDGLGDTADGFGGGWTPEQRLEIMRDPRQGTYGVLAIVCSVVVRVAALGGVSGWGAVAAAAAAHLLARAWAAGVVSLARPARPGGLAHLLAGHGPGRAALAASWLVAVAGAGALVGPRHLALLLAVGGLTTSGAVALAYRKVNGVTGDVLGAVEQLAEIGGLTVLSAGAAAGRWW